jgi:hypothetical protein
MEDTKRHVKNTVAISRLTDDNGNLPDSLSKIFPNTKKEIYKNGILGFSKNFSRFHILHL